MEADREKFSALVEQELEVHLERVLACPGRNSAKPRCIRLAAVGMTYQLETSLLNGNQVSRHIAAVYGRDVRRLENLEVAQVIPVIEVTFVAAHALECPEDSL